MTVRTVTVSTAWAGTITVTTPNEGTITLTPGGATSTVYLTDASSNQLTDAAGNYLISSAGGTSTHETTVTVTDFN